jgi:hypothetical protein
MGTRRGPVTRRRRRARYNKGSRTQYNALRKAYARATGKSPVGKSVTQMRAAVKRKTVASVRRKYEAGVGKKSKARTMKGRKRDSKGRFVGGKGRKRKGRRRGGAKSAVRRARHSLSRAQRRLKTASASLRWRPQRAFKYRKKKGRKSRKNPTGMQWATYAGGGLGGFAVSNIVSNLLKKADDERVLANGDAEPRPWLYEYAAPAVLAGGTWWATKKAKKPMISNELGMGIIAGIAGAVLVRQIPLLSNLPGIKWLLGALAFGAEPYASLKDAPDNVFARTDDGTLVLQPPENGQGTFYAGAAGMGRYLRVSDAYERHQGMGRYLADEAGEFTGLGKFVTVPISESGMFNGLGGLGDSDLMDEIEATAPLTPVEAQAENINPNLSVVRATPASAQRISNAQIGQVIGKSQQVPGTYLVATTVAGRDVSWDIGPRPPGDDYPAANMSYGPGAIGPSKQIDVSPYGVFSRGIFSSSLPTHGGISV